MSLDLVKEKLNTLQIVNEQNETIIIDEDIIVPDTKPDIKNVILFEVDPKISNVESYQSSLMLKGIINYKIVYESDDEDNQIKSIMGESDFSYSINYFKNERNLNCDAKCILEHSDFEIINSRKISFKSVLNLNLKITEENETEFVSDIAEEENLNLLKQNFNIQTYVGRNDKSLTVTDTFKTFDEDMSIQEIIFYDIHIRDKNEKILDDKIEISGTVEVNAYYLCDDDDQTIGSIEAELPFSDYIDLDNINEGGICRTEYNIESSNIELTEDADGELKNIQCEIVLKNSVEGYINKDISLVVDGYSANKELIIERNQYKTNKILDEVRNVIMLNEKHTVDNTNIKLEKGKIISIKPEINTYKAGDGKIFIEGVIKTKILCISINEYDRFIIINKEIPFSYNADINGSVDNTEPNIIIEIKSQQVQVISSSEIQIMLEIESKIQLNQETSNEFIVDAELEAIDENIDFKEPNIKIYFAKPNDTLWNIGKRYCVSLEDIINKNQEIDFDNIEIGQQVLIPKKKLHTSRT